MFKVQWDVNLDEYNHVSGFILASANPYCIFHITFTDYLLYYSLCTFMYRVLYFSFCTFTLHFRCFSFFVIDRTRKQTVLIEWFKFVFIKDLPSVSQSNEQTVTAENE